MSRPAPEPRADLKDLAPYRTSDATDARIALHANENPYPPPPHVMDEIAVAVRGLDLNRYPDPDSTELTAAIADYAGVPTERVVVGDGSNELLLQACLAYGGPGRSALLFEPTYRMHHRQARMAGTSVGALSRTADHHIDADAASERIGRERPDIVFVCTPNNPTGTVTPPDDVRRLADAAAGLVIVDEAYFEFCGVTALAWAGSYANVLIVRTLSKAFGLAGVRLGYAIGDPALLAGMAPVRMPYTQSVLAQATATVALGHAEELLRSVEEIVAERERVAAALDALPGVRAFASGANFVLFRHPAPERAVAALAAASIVVRDFTHLAGCEGCLRVTIGTPGQNDAFCEVMGSVSA